jgi:hypothetical protein
MTLKFLVSQGATDAEHQFASQVIRVQEQAFHDVYRIPDTNWVSQVILQ